MLVDYFRKKELPDLTVVSPDAGGVERARFFAKKMDSALAIVDKRRVEMDVTEVMHVIGDVKGRTCLILDDIIDTAGTLVKTACVRVFAVSASGSADGVSRACREDFRGGNAPHELRRGWPAT